MHFLTFLKPKFLSNVRICLSLEKLLSVAISQKGICSWGNIVMWKVLSGRYVVFLKGSFYVFIKPTWSLPRDKIWRSAGACRVVFFIFWEWLCNDRYELLIFCNWAGKLAAVLPMFLFFHLQKFPPLPI